MASIIIGQAASTIGGAVAGGFGAIAGQIIGSQLGNYLDNRIFSNKSTNYSESGKLENINIQTSTYGRMIPQLYGHMKVAGNIIWAAKIKENHQIFSQRAGSKGSRSRTIHNDYSYTISLAIGICRGPIDDITKVWINNKLIDPACGVWRIYKGDEEQLPDHLIEAEQGISNTPAYRGIAYVVIEDFPIGEYHNQIPNFTFEVKKTKFNSHSTSVIAVEELIESMIIIPGSGEFVYDPIVQSKIYGMELSHNRWVQQGLQSKINQNNYYNKADSIVALDQLQATCKNVSWVAPVVGWFANDMDIENCDIVPGVEYQQGATTIPDEWQVSTWKRDTAHLITYKDDSPVYGGTINDQSLTRYLAELRKRQYKIMLYPMFFMDTPGKPWRGRLTGDAKQVERFFNKKFGYNQFIIHYAKLVKNKVDVFIIGSELIGLTQVKDNKNNFTAVRELVKLAAIVKKILGPKVLVSYAADWSEYHHTEGGWYNLDPLWSSPDIDFIGIDAYFPLTDNDHSTYDEVEIAKGWEQDEGYDFYYFDEQRTIKKVLNPAYAWKNINWWWSNQHVNPDGVKTNWQPKSKKIWFTEFGFPSVDCATNQPNVFYDSSSVESYFPRKSQGKIDFLAQNIAIRATINKWKASPMIERMFLWTWDSRPYPFWPDLRKIWSDGNLWITGHWVNGKLGSSALSLIIKDLCLQAGLEENEIDTSRLIEQVDGYFIVNLASARNAIESLQQAYLFEIADIDGVLTFSPTNKSKTIKIDSTELVINRQQDNDGLTIVRSSANEIPTKISINYLDKDLNYQNNVQAATRTAFNNKHSYEVYLPLVFNENQARSIAYSRLYDSWLKRNSYNFTLSTKYVTLKPNDIVELNYNNHNYFIKINNLTIATNRVIKLIGSDAYDITAYNFVSNNISNKETESLSIASATKLEILDLPILPWENEQDYGIHIAATGLEANWHGCTLYYSLDKEEELHYLTSINNSVLIAQTINELKSSSTGIFDYQNQLDILTTGGKLFTKSEDELINDANLALVGDEIIQFKYAKLITQNHYRLSSLIRGRLGTEKFINDHRPGERFILLDQNLTKVKLPISYFGKNIKYKVITHNSSSQSQQVQEFNYQANALKPFNVVHASYNIDSNHNIIINFLRRSRIRNNLNYWSDITLFENQELYELDILSNNKLIRTIKSNNTKVIYDYQMQLIDFNNLIPSELIINIYQLSDLVGRGNKATIKLITKIS